MRWHFIDKLIACEPGVSATGVMTFTLEDAFFQDHFPNDPIVPGVFLVESMLAAAAATIRLGTGDLRWFTRVILIKNAKFMKPVPAGKQYRTTAKMISQDDAGGVAEAWIEVDGERAAEMTAFQVVNKSADPYTGRVEPFLRAWLSENKSPEAAREPSRMRWRLVDKIVACEPGSSATVVKTFSRDEEFFRDHFPNEPVVPGVLLLETMAGAAGAAIRLGAKDPFQTLLRIVLIKNAKFMKPVPAEKQYRATAKIVSRDGASGVAEAWVEVDGERAAEMTAFLTVHTPAVPYAGWLDGVLRDWLNENKSPGGT